MALVRWITEMGMGVDVHGHDYTKAARRAVSGGLDVPKIIKPDGSADGVVIANAAVLVSFPDD